MTTLHPTPTRLALLAEVDNGKVWGGGISGEDFIRESDFQSRRVTARVNAMVAAGWLKLEPAAFGDYRPRRWQLTGAGRAILDQHRRADT